MIIRGLRIVTRQLVYLTIIAAVVLTLLIAGVYWLSNAVEQRQDEIAVWVGAQVGAPVEIGAASLDWIGLKPKLQVSDIKLLSDDSQQTVLSLGHLYLGLDLVSSVRSGKPVLNDITLTELNIALLRDQSGQIQIQGLSLPTANASQDVEWKSWIQLLNRFHLETIQIDYTDQQNEALSGLYNLANAVITHKADQWTTTGVLILPSNLGQSIAFTAQAELDANDLHVENWQLQSKFNNLILAPLAENIVWQDVKVQKGKLTAQITASGNGADLDTITTEFDLAHATVVSTSTQHVTSPVEIDLLQSQLEWQRTGGSWQLLGRELALSINGDSWPETAFSIKKDEYDTWQIITQYLRLSDLTSFALLSDKTPEIIRQQQAAGDIESLNLRYSAENGLTELAFKLREGVVLPWQNYPGVTNLTAQINWQDGFGSIHLDSRDLIIYAKPWLDNSVFFDSVSGLLKLHSEEGSWQLETQKLRVWNEDLTLQLDGVIDKKSDGTIVNDLKLSLSDVAVNKWKKYIPRKRFPIDFKNWSNAAFVAGEIINGEITLKGDLAAFPYENKPEKGQFKMAFDVKDVQLHYAPDWPDLTGLTGTITSTGEANNLIIKTKQGKTAGFDFIDVTTIISKIVSKKPILRVKGDIKGTTAKALQFLNDSPLKQRFGVVADSALAKGNSNINLNLMVPLADIDKTTVAGHVSFINSQLSYKASPELSLSKVNGKLYFTENGVKAKNIKALAFNDPVIINVKPDGDKAIVSMLGKVSTQEINTIWPNKLPSFISGKALYQVDLTVVERELGEFYLDVDISSNLKGMAIAMPHPFGKIAAQNIALKATMKNTNNALVYSVDYGDIINAVVKPSASSWKGEIRFGEGTANLPENGIKIAGKLNDISIDDWLQWSQQQTKEGDTTLVDSIDEVSLSLEKITGFGQQLTNLNVASIKDAKGWRTNIHSDQTKGFVYLPNDFSGSSKIKVNLEHLSIALPKSKTDKKTVSESTTIDLWPSVELSIASLSLDGNKLGQLKLAAKKSTNAWTISSAELVSDVFSLSVTKGIWQKLATSDSSQFQIKLESNDLDLLFANFGYQQAIDAEKVTMQANVSWPSDPLSFDLATLSGSLNMNIGKGTLQDVEPGAAGRIFGLMSIAALPRRLSLDFRDLFGKGFSFDSINGDFDFKNGHANTDNFALKSASAEILITGDVDLVAKQYNQQVTVTPNVSSTLPLAGAVAGGPIGLGVGTAILLVDKITDKLFGKNIVNIISYKYDLKGPWDDPQLSVSAPTKPVSNRNHNVLRGSIK